MFQEIRVHGRSFTLCINGT